MNANKNTYRAAMMLAVGTGLFLVWSALAMGVNGREGDPFERIYLGVLAVAIIGGVVTRFRPQGMAAAMSATAVAQAVVVVIALVLGKQDEGASSVLEIVAVNGFFILMYVLSARLFQRSALVESADTVRSPGPASGSELQA